MRGLTRSAACAALLAASWCAGGTASAGGDPPAWSCVEVPADTPDGPACERSAWVVAPCAGAAVPRQDLTDCAQAEADLEWERATAERDRAGCELVKTVLARQRDDARAGRAACEAEGARCREQLAESVSSPGLPWWGVLLVGVGAAGLGVVVGVSL